jgi:hypothetical protein
VFAGSSAGQPQNNESRGYVVIARFAYDILIASALAQPDARFPTAAAHRWDFRCSTILRTVLAWSHIQLHKEEEFAPADYRP